MVTLGNCINVQGELYEVVRVLRLAPGKVLPSDFIEQAKEVWHVEKVYRQGDHCYFVNEITSIEPIVEENLTLNEEPLTAIENQEETTPV